MALTYDHVVVGGGATALTAVLALQARQPAASIAIVAPNEVGFGTAFGDVEPLLLTNTPAGVMSLQVSRPDDFVEYLQRRGWEHGASSFVPRFLVAQYCRERFLQARADAARAGGRVHHVAGTAQVLSWEDGSAGAAVVVQVRGGHVVEQVRGHDVVLAMGLARRRAVGEAGSLRRTGHPGRVLVRGSKLSAVDAAVSALARGHRVVMCSPSGTLPAVRTRLTGAARVPHWPRAVAVPAIPEPIGTDPHRVLAHDVAAAAADRAPWQDEVGSFIDEINAAARWWSPEQVEEFRAEHRLLLSRYVSAMPLRNGRLLLAAMNGGRLTVRAGVPEVAPLEVAAEHGGRWSVRWHDGEQEIFDEVIDATGHVPPRLPPCNGQDPVLDPNLRLWVCGQPWPVWAIGSAAHSRTPIVNYLRTAALQADEVAAEATGHITAQVTAPITASERGRRACAAG